MKSLSKSAVATLLLTGLWLVSPSASRADVNAWEGTITIPTYPWEEDVNPKFWALEGGPSLSTTVKGAITYPYTMQDHLSRTKVDCTYKALFLENEYLKVTCLPALGGRLHSVLDKTTGEEMFDLNHVIKPGMIAMRGAWISGGVEWNSGPHGHTVTAVSPVDAVTGKNPDGSAFLEISNQEKIFRTRWTVRVTLQPGRAYLDEKISIFNPTDGIHPYYFWNCTAFPNRPGTRFIYPMTLGMDHSARKFFSWPIYEGKDISWLKNHETWASVFAYHCDFDFFGAYDVDADRGIVQVADHHVLPGKKAWTWGNWEFGRVSQQNLTDEDGPYIEVQSGPLPTQSDYGFLAPSQEIQWQEWWYPVHGLADGFEFATRDLAVETSRAGGKLELRLLATARFPGAVCILSRENRQLLAKPVDLAPEKVQVVTLAEAGDSPVRVTVRAQDGRVLADFTTPLPIPKETPPDPSKFAEKPDNQLTVEEKYYKGRKFDRDTNRPQARKYYELALAEDPEHVASLRALAVLDVEAGLYQDAAARLEKALDRDPDDGLSWYFLGVCRLQLGDAKRAIDCAYQAVRFPATTSLGYDLAGRGAMRLGEYSAANSAFIRSLLFGGRNPRTEDHCLLAAYAQGDAERATKVALLTLHRYPSDLIAQAVLALKDPEAMTHFVQEARKSVGEYEFNMIETSLVFADVGRVAEAARLLGATCYEDVPPSDRSPLPVYYLAYYASRIGDEQAAKSFLKEAAAIDPDFVFPSRPEAVDVLKYAVATNPGDAHAHLHLGNLLAGLGRVDEAVPQWQEAARLNPKLSVAFRNLGLATASRENDPAKAADDYRKAIAARPGDQTLYRDLADILIAEGKRPEAIKLLEAMPYEGVRRADVTILLAQSYLAEKRYDDVLKVLESTPYFVHWEGQDVTWVMFNKAHVARGRIRLEKGETQEALKDFEGALTYPANLGVGRSDRPQEAAAQYWRGKALAALGRAEEARAAWKDGAAGAQGSDEQNEHRKLCQEALGAKEAK
jgi:tetratricopeptide (TPR) repeat protein